MTKILLVEDDKSLREIYGVRLLAEGYDIVSAGDGEEALAMAIKEKPTLIISDVMMPKISGFDMLDILRSTTETRDIKVIMMTALSSDDQRARGEQLGADRYLVKSQVGIEDVVRAVHEVLEDGKVAAPAAAAATVVASTPDPAAAPTEPVAATPVTDTPAPQVDDTVASTVASGSAPGNDSAGPLPPQPSESLLPEPTAPFSSPRPANLGERVIQPLSDAEKGAEAPASIDDQINKELQAASEPVANNQVDEAISDTDVDPAAPAIEAPAFDAPSLEPAATEPIDAPEAPVIVPVPAPAFEETPAPSTPPVDPAAPAVDLEAPAAPEAPANDEQNPPQTPPTISGTSAPIS